MAFMPDNDHVPEHFRSAARVYDLDLNVKLVLSSPVPLNRDRFLTMFPAWIQSFRYSLADLQSAYNRKQRMIIPGKRRVLRLRGRRPTIYQ